MLKQWIFSFNLLFEQLRYGRARLRDCNHKEHQISSVNKLMVKSKDKTKKRVNTDVLMSSYNYFNVTKHSINSITDINLKLRYGLNWLWNTCVYNPSFWYFIKLLKNKAFEGFRKGKGIRRHYDRIIKNSKKKLSEYLRAFCRWKLWLYYRSNRKIYRKTPTLEFPY